MLPIKYMCPYSTATTSRPALSTSRDPGMLNIGSLCMNYCNTTVSHRCSPTPPSPVVAAVWSSLSLVTKTSGHRRSIRLIIISYHHYHLIIISYAAPSVGSISHPAHCSCHPNNVMLLILIFYLLDKVETNTNKSKQWIFIINLYYGLYLSVVIKQ